MEVIKANYLLCRRQQSVCLFSSVPVPSLQAVTAPAGPPRSRLSAPPPSPSPPLASGHTVPHSARRLTCRGHASPGGRRGRFTAASKQCSTTIPSYPSAELAAPRFGRPAPRYATPRHATPQYVGLRLIGQGYATPGNVVGVGWFVLDQAPDPLGTKVLRWNSHPVPWAARAKVKRPSLPKCPPTSFPGNRTRDY